MRLLNIKTGQFVDEDPKHREYAILSHTWDKVEQTYEELKKIQSRYGAASQVPQSHLRGSNDRTSAPPGQTTDRQAPERATSQLPSDSPSLTTPSTTCGRLTQPEVEALFRAFVEKYGLPDPPQSRPSVSAASGEQNPRLICNESSPPAPLLSEQTPPDNPSVIEPLIPRSTRSKPCFARAVARLKTWIQFRSPTSTPPREALGRHRTPENN